MDLKSRLNRAKKEYILKEDLFSPMPDFENWTDKELDKYIFESTEKFNKEQAIKSYYDAEGYYNYICEKGTITEEEKKLYLEIERRYWNG